MTEATDKNKAAETANGLSAGEQLKRARESRNLTIQQVAQALHLDTWILEALEQDRFKDVGAPVFVKGHLRKYASEVGLDTQELMEAYHRADDTPDTPGLVTDTFAHSRGGRPTRWPVIVVSSLLVLALLALFFWFRGTDLPGLPFFADQEADHKEDAASVLPAQQQVTASDLEMEPPLDTAPLRLEGQDTGMPDAAGGQSARSAATSSSTDAGPGSEPSEAVTASAEEAPPAAQGDGQLQFTVTLASDSWVEIYDARNRRLFFDLARAGSTESVTGVPPLQVLLGNADDARVRVNGDVWPIPEAARRGKTARFTVR